MSVTSNLNALGVRRNLNLNNFSLSKSLERLSSGYRINTGADAPADLIISEQLRAQNAGLQRAVQNTQEASNVLGIAEGALGEMSNILKKMRQLAIHSANSGVTSPEQVAADQAEVDSSVQTIDRIARTSKYSDQMLINGNKEITADTETYIDDTRDMELVDLNLSEIFQVFKRDDNSISINYSDDEGANEARKAYFEISSDNAAATQLSTDGTYSFTHDQSFTLAGELGSRMMSFAKGTHLGEMVTSINSVKDSTGVEATLTYDANVESTSSDGSINTASSITLTGEAHSSGTVDFYTRDADGNIVSTGGITSVSLDGSTAGPGSSSYGYSLSSVGGAGVNTFTVGDSNDFSDIITMQFAGITDSDLTGGELYFYNDGTNIKVYTGGDHTSGTEIGSAAIPGSDQKIAISLTGGGTAYLGYTTYSAGASSISDARDATRPFASSLGWQGMDGGTINVEIVTQNVNASALGLSDTTTGLTAANIASAFNITGGTGADVMTAIENNIDAAFAEWKAAFSKVGVNINFNVTSPADTSALGATIGNENTIRIAMASFEGTPSIAPGVVARGGYTGDNQTMYGMLAFDMDDDWTIQDGGSSYYLDTNSDASHLGTTFYDTLMHELGHVFGYAHPNDLTGANGLMSYNNTTPNAEIPYGDSAVSGSILQSGDNSWKDVFMQDALTTFYGASVNSTDVTLDQATMATGAGDEIKVTLLSGPSGSGFSSGVAGSVGMYNSILDNEQVATINSSTNVGDYDPGNVSGVLAGYNTDGLGRVYVKMTSDDDYVIFKDEALTMKVAYGSFDSNNVTTAMAMNNSGLDNLITMTRSPGELKAGYETVIQLDYMQEDVTNTVTAEEHGQGVDMSNLVDDMVIDGVPVFTQSGSFLSGVQLGQNTSDTGNIYVKGVFDGSGTDCYLAMYKDARMRDEDLVAETDHGLDLTGVSNAVRFFAVEGDNGYDTGLYSTLNIGSVTQDFSFDSIIKSTNLAARISSVDYGSDAFVKVDAHQGAVWNYTDAQGDAKLLDSGLTGKEHTTYGQDAIVSVNGQKFTLDGIAGVLSTLDTSANLSFRAGDIGLTTIAASGYDKGAFATRAGQLHYNNDSKYSMLCHATGSTSQIIDNFRGGMQLQIGEGSGSQERTVVSLQSMTATDLGKVYDDDEKVTYCLNDLLSGGLASLGTDPVKALKVIDQAIKDVSEQRARIGAWQSNLLETNANSLSVAIENITKTESYIRDADMAGESTDFSRNQIMVQAGTSMLAQANGLQQNILSLLS